MKFKKITAAFMAVLFCICAMSLNAFAAKNESSIALNKTSASVAIGKSITLKAAASEKALFSGIPPTSL